MLNFQTKPKQYKIVVFFPEGKIMHKYMFAILTRFKNKKIHNYIYISVY